MKTLQERMTTAFPPPHRRGLFAEIARACSVSSPTVTAWFTKPEKVSTISRANAERLCGHFNLLISPEWLAEGTGAMWTSQVAGGPAPSIDLLTSDVGDPIELKGMRRIPVVGEVRGGDDGFLEEFEYPVGYGEGYVLYPTTDPNAYAVRVRGDSMHPRYRAGEFVIVEPNIEAQEGDDVVVICCNGRKMLKQLNWRRDGEVQLLSINNGYGPLTLDKTEIDRIQLVAGRARRNAMCM
ncbi:helix-turn-helix transcriptional regulator [Comamonas odontotermitis]|uniref:S24 family peptidase n=1 Tax=Comamonas odontotermitis TaxID=379895 RepID=UPI00375184AB